MRLLCNYHTSQRLLYYYEPDALCDISTHVVRSPPPHIFKMSSQMTSLTPFLPLLLNRSGFNHVQLLFHFSIYVLPSRRLRHLLVQRSYGSAVCRHIIHSSSLSLLHLAVLNAYHNIQTAFDFACLPYLWPVVSVV